MKISVEHYFLRYAYPCSIFCLAKGQITQEKFDELKDIAVNNKPISRQELERIFFRAFEELDILAKVMNKDRWDFEVIKEYFHKEHNNIINQGKGIYKNWPESMRELSKVFKVKVIDKKGNILVVEYDNGKQIKTRNIMSDFVPEVKINDFVMIHYGYAIEMA